MCDYQDFQEIAHCGGQATFHIVCDDQGRKAYSIGFRSQRPVPAAWVGIYALAPHGIPVADFRIGGIGQPFEPPCPEGCYAVFLGSDSRQCWAHQCPQCEGYFRNGQHPAIYPLTCPYCGLRAAAFQFLTPAQRNYVAHFIETLLQGLNEVMQPGTERELVIDMDAIVDQSPNEPRPDFYYAAQAQQTRYTCEKCRDFNDIRGRYGYCASCGYRNNLASLRATFDELRNRLNAGHATPADTVRSAVSELDACCRDMATQLRTRIPMRAARRTELERLVFHDVESPTIANLKTMFDIDVLRAVDLPFVRMMMHRRHVFEHNGGVADDRYVERSGDTAARAGVLIRETQENAHRLIGALTRVAENFSTDFHEIFTLTPWPIEYHERRERRRAQRQ